MGYNLELNSLLQVPKTTLDLGSNETGKHYTIRKDGERLYPLNIPIEICDDDYTYYGKVAIRRLTLQANSTTLEVEVLKIFNTNERNVYTSNFIKA